MPEAVKPGTDYTFRSDYSRPIGEQGMFQASLFLAELSKLSYFDHDDALRISEPLGVERLEFFDRDGAQAYCLETHHDTVVVGRGTEPDEVNDVKADVNALTVAAETVGRVHRGFKSEADDLWPDIERALIANEKPLWFAGHSLGGALATIFAGRAFVSDIKSMPSGLYTYGSPRVGDRRYINYCDIQHLRWVNNNDIVTRLPPIWFGYRHAAPELYINTTGKYQKLTGRHRFYDRMRGLGRALLRLKIDYLADHPIDRYIEALAGMQDAEA